MLRANRLPVIQPLPLREQKAIMAIGQHYLLDHVVEVRRTMWAERGKKIQNGGEPISLGGYPPFFWLRPRNGGEDFSPSFIGFS